MSLPSHALSQVVVEVKYDRGVVYFDRCGSLMLKLQDELGEPFEGDVPVMQQAELRNDAERLIVMYSPQRCAINQTWVRSVARVEQLAPRVWSQVSETLEVSARVQRCGVRFVLVWKVGNVEEAERRLHECGLFKDEPSWTSMFGNPATRMWVTTSKQHAFGLRAALHGSETKLKGDVPTDLSELVPRYSISLDLDYTMPDEAPFKLSPSRLKDFVRTTWEHAKVAAEATGTRLGMGNA